MGTATSASRRIPPAHLWHGRASLMVMVAAAVVVVTASWALAADPAPSPRQLLIDLRGQLQVRDLVGARATARRYLRTDPSHTGVWYNLAGIEEQLADHAAAEDAFAEAVALGFDDFRYAEADTDLGDLRRSARFRSLHDAWREGLADRQQQRRLNAVPGTWSEPFDLPDRGGGLTPPTATVRLKPDPDALLVEALVTDPRPDDVSPPWLGGSGLVVTVVVPSNPAAVDGVVFHEFAVGFLQKLPTGAILVRGARTFWQRLGELTPTIREQATGGPLRYELSIPWTAIAPHDPLADPVLGIGVTYLGATDAGGDRLRAALLADPATAEPTATHRRFVPLTVDWSRIGEPALAGRVEQAVARSDTLELALAVASSSPGPVRFEIGLVPRSGDPRNRVVQLSESVVPAGRTEIPLKVALGALPDGPARLQVAATFPGDVRQHWSAGVLRLRPGWEERIAGRLATLPSRDRHALQLRVDAVRSELRDREPRRDPGPLSTTMTEIEALWERFDATGTVLPDGGAFLTGMPASAGQPPRRCSLDLPAGLNPEEPARLLVILSAAPGAEARVADLARRTLDERTETGEVSPPALIVAVPHDGQDRPLAAARQSLIWARDFLPEGTVLVAGADPLAGPVLQAVLERPADVAGLMLMTTGTFALDLESSLTILLDGGGPEPGGPVIHWIEFPDESGPSREAHRTRTRLETAGLPPATVETVPGGLSLSQIAGRAALWAVETR